MAHEFESGFFTGVGAWHGLGVVLREAPTVEEGLRVAGLDWGILEAPLFGEVAGAMDGGPAGRVPVTSHKLLLRDSDRAELGVVGREYKVWTNRDAFAWFCPLVVDGTVKLEAAGSLKGGKRVWILGRYADPIEPVKGDAIVPYLLLATSHDGTMSVRLLNTPVRVVCANTMSAAGAVEDGDAMDRFAEKGGAAFSHTTNVAQRVTAAREWVTTARRGLEATRELYARMAGKGIDLTTLRAFARGVFDADYHAAQALLARLRTRIFRESGDLQSRLSAKAAEIEKLLATPSKVEAAVEDLFESGAGHELAGSTVYGAFNAATSYIDHGRSRSPEAGMDASWFGPGVGLRSKALREAVKLLG
jgi:phage/plasmid-like protein (TIGR03299 family)